MPGAAVALLHAAALGVLAPGAAAAALRGDSAGTKKQCSNCTTAADCTPCGMLCVSSGGGLRCEMPPPPPPPLGPPPDPFCTNKKCSTDADCGGKCTACNGEVCIPSAALPLGAPPAQCDKCTTAADCTPCGMLCVSSAGGLRCALPPPPPPPLGPPPDPFCANKKCSTDADCGGKCTTCNGEVCIPSAALPLGAPPAQCDKCTTAADCTPCGMLCVSIGGGLRCAQPPPPPPPLGPPPQPVAYLCVACSKSAEHSCAAVPRGTQGAHPSLARCKAACGLTPAPTPRPTCGGSCSTSSDCGGFACGTCLNGECRPTPPPLGPPPLPEEYICTSACGAPQCVAVPYGTQGAESYPACDAACGPTSLRAPPRAAAAARPGACADVVPGTVLAGVARRLLRAPDRLGDFAAIAARHGATEVRARVMDEGGYNAPPFTERALPLRDYLHGSVLAPAGAAGRVALYMQQADLFGVLPALAEEAGVPADGARALCPRLPRAEHAGYFVCPRGVTTPLHVDNGDFSSRVVTKGRGNLFVQLSGRKRVVLIPPSVAFAKRGELYPSDGERWAHVSRAHRAVEGCRLNETRAAGWPGLGAAWARRAELVLGPGDGVLIPSWWWHCTESLDDGAAVNWWFDEGL